MGHRSQSLPASILAQPGRAFIGLASLDHMSPVSIHFPKVVLTGQAHPIGPQGRSKSPCGEEVSARQIEPTLSKVEQPGRIGRLGNMPGVSAVSRKPVELLQPRLYAFDRACCHPGLDHPSEAPNLEQRIPIPISLEHLLVAAHSVVWLALESMENPLPMTDLHQTTPIANGLKDSLRSKQELSPRVNASQSHCGTGRHQIQLRQGASIQSSNISRIVNHLQRFFGALQLEQGVRHATAGLRAGHQGLSPIGGLNRKSRSRECMNGPTLLHRPPACTQQRHHRSLNLSPVEAMLAHLVVHIHARGVPELLPCIRERSVILTQIRALLSHSPSRPPDAPVLKGKAGTPVSDKT
jgi:hypothetical protein